MILRRRLQWLGHVARMDDTRLPKQFLFCWLTLSRPPHGPRKRWRDAVRDDLQSIHLYTGWYSLAADRLCWFSSVTEAVEKSHCSSPSPRLFSCSECHRIFRRKGDMAKHKCSAERKKPLSDQVGAVQCASCQRWFASRGGLAVHTCQPSADNSTLRSSQRAPDNGKTCCHSHCPECDRCFKSSSGFRRHNCNRGKRPDRTNFSLCCSVCSRTFRRPQDLARHKCKL